MYTRTKDGEIIKTRIYNDKNINEYNKKYLNILINEAMSMNEYNSEIEIYVDHLKMCLSKIK